MATSPAQAKPLRADARRNYEAIVRAAAEEVDRVGADASLEDIAKRAGVGSATLHRHFRSRRALLQAVFADRVAALCGRAAVLSADEAPADALRDWLTELAVYSAATRGLADTLLLGAEPEPEPSSCEAMLADAAGELRDRAVSAGAVSASVRTIDLLALVNSLSLGAQSAPAPGEFAERLVGLALEGIAPTHENEKGAG